MSKRSQPLQCLKNIVSKTMWGAREPLDTEIQKDSKNTIEIHQRHVSSVQPSIKSLISKHSVFSRCDIHRFYWVWPG